MPTNTTVSRYEAFISDMSSTMGRLVWLAECRDLNSGVYRPPSPELGAEAAVIQSGLMKMHEAVFNTWLNCTLQEQVADVSVYFSNLKDRKSTVAAQEWLIFGTHRRLVPTSASRVERQLFFSDMELVLKLIVHGTTTIALELEGYPNVTARQLSRMLGISQRSLRASAERCKIPGRRVGRQWMFSIRDIRDYFKALLNHLGTGTREIQRSRSGSQDICALNCSRTGLVALSAREREVLVLIGQGKTGKEIAGLLGIKENTVADHRKHIRRKLDLHSTGEIVACAARIVSRTCRAPEQPWLSTTVL